MKGTLRTGLESGMDLNRVGKIEMSDEPAFEVEARDAHGPKADLDPETRWFVQTLGLLLPGPLDGLGPRRRAAAFDRGAFRPSPNPWPCPMALAITHPRLPPATLARKRNLLVLQSSSVGGGRLGVGRAADGNAAGASIPHLGENPVQASLFFRQVGADSRDCQSRMGGAGCINMAKSWRRPADPDRTPAKDVNAKYKQFLLNQDVPERHHLLGTRSARHSCPSLTEAERAVDAKGRLPAAAHAKVAQALTNYLTQSGEFGYSLDLHRYQMNLDPLADFLLNVKEGHCERFAGGLNLMLRSLGIPARVIKGYRGVEPLEEGRYLVRQRQAHSWVQALMRG